MKNMIEIHNWGIKADNTDPWKAPETIGKVVVGKVYGHPNFENGTDVVTSPIVKVNGRFFSTESGREYTLCGDPTPAYFDWMKEHGFVYNYENPIAIKT